MVDNDALSSKEAADLLAIRTLVDAYARCADRRDAAGQMALFTEDMRFIVFMDSRDPQPTQQIERRADLAPVFEHLKSYEATTSMAKAQLPSMAIAQLARVIVWPIMCRSPMASAV